MSEECCTTNLKNEIYEDIFSLSVNFINLCKMVRGRPQRTQSGAGSHSISSFKGPIALSAVDIYLMQFFISPM
jgi:hypothetical protein